MVNRRICKWFGWQKNANHPIRTSKKKTHFYNKDNLKGPGEKIKCTNICIIGVPGEEKEKGLENVFDEIMAKNCLNWRRKLISKYRIMSQQIKPKRPTSRHIIIKMVKIKVSNCPKLNALNNNCEIDFKEGNIKANGSVNNFASENPIGDLVVTLKNINPENSLVSKFKLLS